MGESNLIIKHKLACKCSWVRVVQKRTRERERERERMPSRGFIRIKNIGEKYGGSLAKRMYIGTNVHKIHLREIGFIEAAASGNLLSSGKGVRKKRATFIESIFRSWLGIIEILDFCKFLLPLFIYFFFFFILRFD